jgi:CBS domain-containing protein
MRVGECCNRLTVVCDRNAGVGDAARLMKKHNVGTVVVVDRSGGSNRPVSIVTDRDLVFKALARKCPAPEQLSLNDLIDDEVFTARSDDGVWETLERMRTRSIRQLAVINRNGALEGLLAIDDVVQWLAEVQRGAAQLARVDREADRGYVAGADSPQLPKVSGPGIAEWARVA